MELLFLTLVVIGFILNIELDKLRKLLNKKLSARFKAIQFLALVFNLVGGFGCLAYVFRSIADC